MKNTGSTILILGTGYIGSALISTFYDNCKIICIDHGKNFSKLQNKFPKVNFIKGNCTNQNLLREYAQKSNFIFYTINTGGVMDCTDNPEKFKKINLDDFKIIIDILNEFNSNLLLLSSSFVYPDIPNITEKISPQPETYYGKLRLNQEKILENSKVNYVILRLSNVFGFGSNLNIGNQGVIEKFINLTFSKNEIVLHGNGRQKIDCLYIDDLMELIKMLVRKRFDSKIFNVSTQKNYTVLEISKIIQEIAQRNYKINLNVQISDDSIKLPNSPLMSSEKIKKYTNWKPTIITLDKKIEEMMNLFSKHIM